MRARPAAGQSCAADGSACMIAKTRSAEITITDMGGRLPTRRRRAYDEAEMVRLIHVEHRPRQRQGEHHGDCTVRRDQAALRWSQLRSPREPDARWLPAVDAGVGLARG